MLSSQSFTGSPALASGANSVSIVAESGGGTTTTNAYKVRVASTSPSTLTYDANGNMTDDGTNSFEWDAEDRLIKIIYPGANNFTEFTYDALGRRVKIVETTAGSVTSTKQFVNNGNEICEERDAYNAVTKQFLALGWTDGTNNHFYGLNHLGSKTEVTDASGNIEEQSSYTPFGVQTLLQGSAISDFGYAGMYKHQRSGLNLTMFRAYNPDLGRWISRDPIGETGGMNLYGYVGNNTMSLIDPMGLDAWGSAILGGIGAGLGGVILGGGGALGGTAVAPGVGTIAGGAAGWGQGAAIGGAAGWGQGAAIGGAAGVVIGSQVPLGQAIQQLGQELSNIGQQIGNILQASQSNPLHGQPNSTSTTPNGKQTRTYDENGNPQYDIDQGHAGEPGVGGQDHIHEWDWYNPNIESIKGRRGKSQPIPVLFNSPGGADNVF